MVYGQLLSSSGGIVGKGNIRLQGKGDKSYEMPVDPQGGYCFKGLEPGTYRLLVVEGSLPEGYTSPFRQNTREQYKAYLSPGFFATDVEIHGDEEVKKDIFVHMTASVEGTILGSKGEGIEGASVRLASVTPGLGSLSLDTISDANGNFLVKDVIPGHYRTNVMFGERHPYEGISKPEPQKVRVIAGQRTSVVIQLGMGKCWIAGKVLNQDGLPFSDITVLCWYYSDPEDVAYGERRYTWTDQAGSTKTDADGNFVLEGLYPSMVKVMFEPNGYEPTQKLWDENHKLVRWGEQVKVDLHRDQSVQLDPVTLVESRPYIVEGQLTSDDEVKFRKFEVVIYLDTGDPEIVKVSRSGEFKWGCETEAPPEVVSLFVRNEDGEDVYMIDLTPEPNRIENLEVPIQ